jgi:hypothetical protein
VAKSCWFYLTAYNPQGFLNDFVIDRLKNGFVVPLFTRQIKKLQPCMSEVHQKYAWESREQVMMRGEGHVKLLAK